MVLLSYIYMNMYEWQSKAAGFPAKTRDLGLVRPVQRLWFVS